MEANVTQGLFVSSGKASIADSVASGNTSVGIEAGAPSPSFTAEVNVESCLVANNAGNGIVSGPATTNTVRVSNSTVTDNATFGLEAESLGVLLSRTDNTVEGNGTDTSGTSTYTAK